MDRRRIYLVDDDPSCLEATARMLRLSGYEVSSHGSAEDFLCSVDGESRGCVVTDLRMPEIDGLRLQQKMDELGIRLPVIFLTAHGTIPSTVDAMRHGAEDFLTKDVPMEVLVAAIERALAREQAAYRERRELRRLEERFRRLTPREREVLQLVVDGNMNKQIAARLGIHERTVKLHRSTGMKKLEVSSVATLTTLWNRLHGKV